ncbi:MAG: HAD-IA family hydrolase [Nanoarchaeota archaeon]|nr:HAD-IA family hydrolase [Nanoarchaeota archaeon]
MIKVIIFDLDDTLCNTSSTLNDSMQEIFRAMIDAGLPARIKDIDLSDNPHAFIPEFASRLAKKYGAGKEAVSAGMEAYYNYVGNPELFPEVNDMLQELGKYKLILLTTGRPDAQKKKVELLGIKNHFQDIIFDDIANSDKGKKMRDILDKYSLKPEEVVVVGDKIFSEIEAANRLGIISVRCMRGRFKDAEPANKQQLPDYKIDNLMELRDILK